MQLTNRVEYTLKEHNSTRAVCATPTGRSPVPEGFWLLLVVPLSTIAHQLWQGNLRLSPARSEQYRESTPAKPVDVRLDRAPVVSIRQRFASTIGERERRISLCQ